MKSSYLLLTALLALIICLASAKDGTLANSLSDEDVIDDNENAVVSESSNRPEADRRRDPCLAKQCNRGEICVLAENRQAKCVCVTDCSYYNRRNSKFKVCSNKNVTYKSECDLDRDHCLCKHKDPGCSSPGVKKIHLEYYGECQDVQTCSEEHARQFPHRLRDWLFVVMEEMARRAAIGEYMNLLQEAAHDKEHAYAVIWKFCDLDKDPQDRRVSRRELQYTVRSLRAMEHCILPFLDGCDQDGDRDITLVEWGTCLGLGASRIVDKCLNIHKGRNGK